MKTTASSWSKLVSLGVLVGGLVAGAQAASLTYVFMPDPSLGAIPDPSGTVKALHAELTIDSSSLADHIITPAEIVSLHIEYTYADPILETQIWDKSEIAFHGSTAFELPETSDPHTLWNLGGFGEDSSTSGTIMLVDPFFDPSIPSPPLPGGMVFGSGGLPEFFGAWVAAPVSAPDSGLPVGMLALVLFGMAGLSRRGIVQSGSVL